ncbi:hypothetical protein [Sulfurimonas sp.]|uniref:hypothetical protein n=1 Tax=Sulfurimonas sp. TaxID=2022749 RepID=UPI002624405F|nr:hypothetical protein [Sulfurimonas sp.]
MKIYIMLLVSLLLFSACANKNAFDDFNITKKQALSVEQIQSSKMKNENGVTGIATALYLNNVDKKEFHGDEYFYVSLFIKGSKSEDIQFLLNSKKPLQVKALTNTNRFTKLTSLNATWLKYYLVTFNKVEGNLKLQIKDNNNSSRLLLFKNLELVK